MRQPVFGGLRTTEAQTTCASHIVISAFVIHLFESIISNLVTSEILIFYVVSVAEQAILVTTVSETQWQGSHLRLYMVGRTSDYDGSD